MSIREKLTLLDIRRMLEQGSSEQGPHDTVFQALAEKLWYDWFCEEADLVRRTALVVPKAMEIAAILQLPEAEYCLDLKNCSGSQQTFHNTGEWTYDVVRLFPLDENRVSVIFDTLSNELFIPLEKDWKGPDTLQTVILANDWESFKQALPQIVPLANNGFLTA